MNQKNIKKSKFLISHHYSANENNAYNIEKMCEIMGNHYDTIKKQVGIRDVFNDSESDEENQKVF